MQEAGEGFLELVEKRRTEGPEVHRDQRAGGHDVALAVERVAAHVAVVLAFDVEVFLDVGEEALLVDLADAAVDVAVVGEGVFQRIADHGHLVGGAFRQAVEKRGGALIGVAAVEIVGIDHGEVALSPHGGRRARRGRCPRVFRGLPER